MTQKFLKVSLIRTSFIETLYSYDVYTFSRCFEEFLFLLVVCGLMLYNKVRALIIFCKTDESFPKQEYAQKVAFANQERWLLEITGIICRFSRMISPHQLSCRSNSISIKLPPLNEEVDLPPSTRYSNRLFLNYLYCR